LALVNSAAINMGVRCFCNNLSCIPLGTSLGVVLLDYMADLCLVFFFILLFIVEIQV
jgi:hypothetical protein